MATKIKECDFEKLSYDLQLNSLLNQNLRTLFYQYKVYKISFHFFKLVSDTMEFHLIGYDDPTIKILLTKNEVGVDRGELMNITAMTDISEIAKFVGA